MRYLTAACPPIQRILLVESGSRHILEAAIPRLRQLFGPQTGFDLATCFPGEPGAFGSIGDASRRIWRTQEFPNSHSRKRLVSEAAERGDTVLAIICSQESIMRRWKWWLAWRMPSKVLIINENADCFWIDTANARTVWRFVLQRSGLSGEGNAKLAAMALLLPFTFLYLLLYASVAHAGRAWRRATGMRMR